MLYRYNKDKNTWLLETRNISFDTIIAAIQHGGLLDIKLHKDPVKYPNQLVYFVFLEGYVYIVPFVIEDDGSIFLKTAYPSRKAKKKYLGGK